ncbi:MAG: CRISPR-associated helicase Cas3' [bacterium]
MPEEISELSQQENWIKAAFSAIPRPEQIADILACRLHCAVEEIEDRLRPFQKEAAEKAGPITFLKAGCGTGKTLAAYHWAREHCPGKRVYICYPTTGTATEGFRDYLFNPDEKTGKYGADLFTSRADVDKAIILGIHRGREEEDPEEGVIRIESLKAWSTPMVSCTVDTVLGLIQNNRRGLYAWPALAGAAFVFDEIHAYDDKLFGALLRFLEALHGVPVLLMTASLPQIRLEILRNKCQKMGIGLVEIDGPKEIEEIPRYHRQGTIDNQDPLPAIQREYVRGGKILWVCNTVNRAMDAYDRAKVAGLEPILYHSRFRYEDRVQQHQQVIARFKEYEPQAALAICTQVAEMSLDLSASLLVTDLAPVPALIQRLGRLNRRANKGDPTCLFIVIEPVDEAGDPENLPYTAAELDSARRWLGVLPETGISQLDLAQVWEVKIEDSKERRPAYCPSAWLDGGPITNVLELREGSPGITVIQERDRQRVVEDYRELKKVLIPMNPPPRHQEWHKWPRYRGIPIAPEGTIEYHEERGARWQKKEQK